LRGFSARARREDRGGMTALTLYPYQQRWFKDRSRFKIGRFARQTGKTFTTTLELCDDVLEAEARGVRSPWVILSRGERQAREAMEEGVFRHLEAYGRALKTVGIEELEFYDEDSGLKRKALQVVLSKLNKITALPANPDTARGFSANVFLDEFAFHADSRKIWTALFPVISAGFKLRVTSTPNGKGNKFYDLATGSDPVWSRHTVDIHQAVTDGLPRDIEEMKAALNDDDAWAQEFELQWLDEASSWLSFDLINGVEHDHAGIEAHYTGGPCFVGVDIAARNDLFVIWVLEAVGDVLWTREIVARRRISFAEQDALLDDVFRRYRVVRCCMDQTGMGEKPVQDAQARHGTLRVEGVIFTGPNKLVLATSGKEAFEDRKIRIPLGDPDLRNDLHKLKKEQSPTGAPRFVADSDSSGHADRAWACFLAVHAASSPAVIEFESTGEGRIGLGAYEGGIRSRDLDEDEAFGVVSGNQDFEGWEL
jgi:phage FluMu gp28-like protein